VAVKLGKFIAMLPMQQRILSIHPSQNRKLTTKLCCRPGL